MLNSWERDYLQMSDSTKLREAESQWTSDERTVRGTRQSHTVLTEGNLGEGGRGGSPSRAPQGLGNWSLHSVAKVWLKHEADNKWVFNNKHIKQSMSSAYYTECNDPGFPKPMTQRFLFWKIR